MQAEGRDDLNFNEDIDEREKREHGLRGVAGDGEEDSGQSEGLIEDPAEGGNEKRDEQERAAVLEPIPVVAAGPEIDQGPDAAEDGGDECDPLGGRVDAVAQEVAETRSELASDDRGMHVVRVLAPGSRVDKGCDERANGEGCGASGEDAKAAGDEDPDEQHEGVGEKEMRLESAQPERGAGKEGAGLVQAEKEREPAEHEDGSLAENDAEERGGKQ